MVASDPYKFHYIFNEFSFKVSVFLTLFRMGFFFFKKAPPSLKSVTYPTMMKLGTVIPYLKKFQKL